MKKKKKWTKREGLVPTNPLDLPVSVSPLTQSSTLTLRQTQALHVKEPKDPFTWSFNDCDSF